MKVSVNLGDQDNMPSCECLDWSRYHMPCRHMFAAMRDGDTVMWDKLSPLYLQSVYCTVDGKPIIHVCLYP